MDKATKKLQLEAKKRDVFGKKLRKLRIGGDVPANIYGPAFKSESIMVNWIDFNKTYKVAEETGIVYLKYDKQEVPSLIKNVQRHPVSHQILHVDFRKIDLKQKIETAVPVKIVGESPAVEQKGGVLLTQANELTVEALPEEIPHEIEVDISKLTEVGQEIKVSDLASTGKYTVKDEADKLIASVIAHKEESLEPETAPAAEPEVLTEKEGEETVVEGAEGVTPAEEKKAEGKTEGKKEEKPEQKSPEPKKEEK